MLYLLLISLFLSVSPFNPSDEQQALIDEINHAQTLLLEQSALQINVTAVSANTLTLPNRDAERESYHDRLTEIELEAGEVVALRSSLVETAITGGLIDTLTTQIIYVDGETYLHLPAVTPDHANPWMIADDPMFDSFDQTFNIQALSQTNIALNRDHILSLIVREDAEFERVIHAILRPEALNQLLLDLIGRQVGEPEQTHEDLLSAFYLPEVEATYYFDTDGRLARLDTSVSFESLIIGGTWPIPFRYELFYQVAYHYNDADDFQPITAPDLD